MCLLLHIGSSQTQLGFCSTYFISTLKLIIYHFNVLIIVCTTLTNIKFLVTECRKLILISLKYFYKMFNLFEITDYKTKIENNECKFIFIL